MTIDSASPCKKIMRFGVLVFGGGFKSSKCKTMAKLATARIKLLRNKREVVVKQMRRDIALLLQSGQDTTARIRVEHVIREQNIMAATEIIDLFCELIVARLSIISKQKTCPEDLKEGICSLIFSAPRCSDIPELAQLRDIFEKKYGKEFVSAATELRPDCGVNRTLIEKLSVRTPSGEVKLKLMKEIAKEYQIEWDTTESEKELLKPFEELIEGASKFVSAASMPVKSASSYGINSSSNRYSANGRAQEEPSKFASTTSMPVKSTSSYGVDSSSNRLWNDDEGDSMHFEDMASAAKAASESAQQAVAAAQAAAYLANRENQKLSMENHQLTKRINSLNGPDKQFSRNKYSYDNSPGSPVLPSDSPVNIPNRRHHSKHSFSDSPSLPPASGSPIHSNNGRHHQSKLPGRVYESQNLERSRYSSDEEPDHTVADNKRVQRRHSYNAPKARSNIQFDESEESESDCDKEIEMDRTPPAGISAPPPNRPAPKLPPPHTSEFDERTGSVENSGSYSRRNSGVHPKLPDYDILAARFEALKTRKP
ncbi:hypothetical protein MKW98_015305 [Papaver atlanticum]|uniref:IST1-like protein n=1 Tax=Papaver atlanticum TaxID=357466 RepID=A0AAD4T6R8_9MAGN|nr:hypothetical protein MKW98_015305 [Papaver atlanticum]